MSIPIKTAKRAAQYLRAFMQENTREWAEMMIETNPNKGWGRGQDAADAHDAAMFLHVETDERFLSFTLPGDFASGAHLLSALRDFSSTLGHYRKLLELRSNEAIANGDTPAMTVGIVYPQLEKCAFAIDEAIRMLCRAAETATPREAFDALRRIATRFPDVVAQLSKRRIDKGGTKSPLVMEDEYDVQYLFQALLRLEFGDVRPEESMPSTSGGSGRADTLLRVAKTMIEYKMTRPGYNAVALRKELADDFLIYEKHPDCERLFAFIYDPGRHISNPRGVEFDLSKPRPPISQVVTFIQQG